MDRMSTLSSEKRNDLHLTSSGIALAVRDCTPWLPSKQPLRFSRPLPPLIRAPPTVPASSREVYRTTAMGDYLYLPQDPELQESEHRKAADHWRVHYSLDTLNRVEERSWCEPLTVGRQKSEMQAQYCNLPPIIDRVLPNNDPQLPMLADHFNEGPTKHLVPSTMIRKTQKEELAHVAHDETVLDRNHPYITTKNRYHRKFTQRELGGYVQNDNATFWLCEDYPKAWGYGVKKNPLEKPLNDKAAGTPMRDKMVFRSATCSDTRLPFVMQPLAMGLHSEYQGRYLDVDKEKRKHLFHCPVKSTMNTQEYDTSLVKLVPDMYKTDNMMYGSYKTPCSQAC